MTAGVKILRATATLIAKTAAVVEETDNSDSKGDGSEKFQSKDDGVSTASTKFTHTNLSS